ncbi:hypothetical protein A9Q87_00820 [Flavobacteriales bacterium 34_180_T64]|nr:hypothetical protein A9Q87_00820 [Flavobacteriales bacterium 34_180_T64]
MRNLFLLLTITVFCTSCSIKEKPVFLRVENIEVLDANLELITVKADAFFENPNDIRGSLKSDEIAVFVNDVKIAKVSSEDFKVPAKKEFSIPLTVNISTDSILKGDSQSIFSSLLNSVLSKSLKVQYKGDIVYKTLGFSYAYPIDETETVKIKF